MDPSQQELTLRIPVLTDGWNRGILIYRDGFGFDSSRIAVKYFFYLGTTNNLFTSFFLPRRSSFMSSTFYPEKKNPAFPITNWQSLAELFIIHLSQPVDYRRRANLNFQTTYSILLWLFFTYPEQKTIVINLIIWNARVF